MGKIEGAEYFDDIIGEGGVDGKAGVLDSHGLRDYDSERQNLKKEGLCVELNCRFCNRRRQIVVEWPELFIIGANQPNLPPIAPRDWAYSQNNGSIYFQTPCPSCGNAGLSLHITPDEARKSLNTGLQSGLISQQDLANWKPVVVNMRRQQGINLPG